MVHVLVVDDDKAICQTLRTHYQKRGYTVSVAHSAEDALAVLLHSRNIDAIISDIRLPEKSGLDLLTEVKGQRSGLPVIMVTAFHDLEMTVAAMQRGASDYVPKPIDLTELDIAVERALLTKPSLRTEHDMAVVIGATDVSRTQIIGQSFVMKELFKSIGLIAQTRVTALILGESGTGKELVARAVHNASAEKTLPFVAVNCAALVDSLLESELFGHEKGAFTGAVTSHKGKIEQVGEGTLFLDEVAELSPLIQGKLLRVLEAREYCPVGGSQIRYSAARFIAATNVDLKARVELGAFREDLYYRLNVATINLPALRDRREDIPSLVEFLIRKINKNLKKNIRQVSGEAMKCLLEYSWPGNVRQLENALMKAAVMERGDTLTADRLAPEIRERSSADAINQNSLVGQLCSLRDVERDHISRVLTRTGWHKGKACEILGISRPTLERRILEFDLAPSDPASNLRNY